MPDRPRQPAPPLRDVSGHRWWKKGTCTTSTTHVYNCLYEWYTDGSKRQKTCSTTKQLRPYTGSGEPHGRSRYVQLDIADDPTSVSLPGVAVGI